MDDLERLLIERECERLVTAYCHFVDHGEAARIADLFTEDGTWSGGGNLMKGREELAKQFGARQANTARTSRHVCQNFLCNVIDEDHAEGVVYLTLYRHDGEPGRGVSPLMGAELVGEYRDRFRRTPQGWRIESRETIASFVRRDA
jgi:hypothetical protein